MLDHLFIRRHLVPTGLLLCALGLTACSGLLAPNSIMVDQGELQRLLERRFPLERRWLEVIEVSASQPQVRLQAEHNRIAAEMNIQARDRVLGLSWVGRLAFDAGLRYDSVEQAVRLHEVRAVRPATEAASTDSSRSRLAERVGALLTERLLEDFVIYKLPPQRLEQLQRLGVRPAAVNVTTRGVEISLVGTR